MVVKCSQDGGNLLGMIVRLIHHKGVERESKPSVLWWVMVEELRQCIARHMPWRRCCICRWWYLTCVLGLDITITRHARGLAGVY